MGETLLLIAGTVALALYVAYVSRRTQRYESVARFDYPVEEVFESYFPGTLEATVGHPFWPTGASERSASELRAQHDQRAEIVETRFPTAAIRSFQAPGVSDVTKTTYRFEPHEGGTRVFATTEIARGALRADPLDRLLYPFLDRLDARQIKARLDRRKSGPEATPMVARSPLALALALLAVAVLAWQLGWIFALTLTVVIFVHELGHVVAARWYGHTSSSLVLVPFFGGIANTGPSASHGELVVKTLAGPAFGLLACAACAALLYAVQTGGTEDPVYVVTGALLVHGLNLLPIGILDGGRVLRSVVVSMGGFGQRLWIAVGVLGLLAGGYLAWQAGGALPWIVIVVSGLVLYGDATTPAADGLTPLTGLGTLASVAGYLGVALAHVALLLGALILFPRTSVLTLTLADPASIEAVHLRASRAVLDDMRVPLEDRQAWAWGDDLMTSSARTGDSIRVRVASDYVLRIRLRDGRDCHSAQIRSNTDATLAIDAPLIDGATCR